MQVSGYLGALIAFYAQVLSKLIVNRILRAGFIQVNRESRIANHDLPAYLKHVTQTS